MSFAVDRLFTGSRIGTPSWAARVDDVLDRAVAERRVVGSVVMIAHEGRVVYRRAVGLADRELERPMEEDAVFRLSSLTKPIVSTAALALIERGVLGLDDSVTNWLPTFRPALPDGRAPSLTVRQLLTHTSGLGYGMFDEEAMVYGAAGVSNGIDGSGLSFDENARRLASSPLFAAPGTAFRYSLSTDILGEVMARAAKKTLPEIVADEVTRPIAMSDTSFKVHDVGRLVTPYADGETQPVRMNDELHLVPFPGGSVRFAPSRVLHSTSYPSGGGGMVGTAADYLRFVEAIRQRDARLLEASSYDAMLQNQIARAERPTSIPGDGWGFGFGVAMLLDPALAGSPLSAGAWHWEGVYGHSFAVDPSRGVSTVALTNTTLEGMFGRTPIELVQAVYG